MSETDEQHGKPEDEPQSNGFRVTLDQPQQMWDAIQNGISGKIGHHHFEPPLDTLEMQVFSGRTGFNLITKITANKAIRYDSKYAELIRNFASNQEHFREKGGHFLIACPQGTVLLMYQEGGDWHISTGLIAKAYRPEENLQLILEPEKTVEKMEQVFTDFTGMIEKFVKYLWQTQGTTPPNETMILEPPTRKIEADGSSRSKTSEDLLRRIEIEKPNINFDEIGGQDEAKKEIEGLAFALKSPHLYKEWGTRPPKGIILFGPPGTGKTLMAKALASQAEAQFFHVAASDISSKWYGESERIMTEIFSLAGKSEHNKTIIFFDEIDAIAPQRQETHEVTHRVISTLLENIDGLASNPNIMVVASTNRLDSIDPALLRAGRFDRWVEVALPNLEGRKQILSIHLKKAEKIAERSIFQNLDQEEILNSAENLSGADIAELVRRTLEEKVRQAGRGETPSPVSTQDFLQQLKQYEKIRKTRKQIGFLPNGD